MNLMQIGTSLGSNGIANVMKGIASQWDGSTTYGVFDSSKNESTWSPPKFWGRRKFLNFFPQVAKKSLLDFCESREVDVFLLHYAPLDGVGFKVARKLKKPVYYYYHNVTDVRFYSGQEKQRRLLEDEAMLNVINEVDGVFCNSHFTAQKIKEKIGREAVVASPAVDVDFFKPENCQKKDDAFRLVHVGRGVPHKGLLELLGLVHELFQENDKIHFDYIGHVGSDSYGLKCRNLLNHDGITWWENADDQCVRDIFQQGDLFVSASQFEGFGMPFLEAAACGLPSVGYRISAIPEVVSHSDFGFLVDEGSIKQFKAAIKKYLSNPDLVLRHGKQARAASLKRTWKRSVQLIQEAMGFSSVLG